MAIEGIFGTVLFGKVMGGFRTFHKIQKKTAGRYHDSHIHLQKPLTQRGGNELTEIEMSIVLNGAWTGSPQGMLSQLHLYQENALAAPLIVGGRPMAPGLSLFVLRSLSETHLYWLKGGILLHAELELELKEYMAFTSG